MSKRTLCPSRSQDQDALCELLEYEDWQTLAIATEASRRAIAVEFEALLRDSSEQADLILGLDSETPTLDITAVRALSLKSEGVLLNVLEAFIAESRFELWTRRPRNAYRRSSLYWSMRQINTLNRAMR
jgi:hypothetical protein